MCLLLFSPLANGQNNCNCVDNPKYSSFINCDTITFNNDIILYRQFNCDSSWLTIEKKGFYKTILNKLNKRLIDLTPKLGYQFAHEYSNSILFINRQVSGGGLPMNYELIDKKTGTTIQKYRPIIYYSPNNSSEIIVTVIRVC